MEGGEKVSESGILTREELSEVIQMANQIYQSGSFSPYMSNQLLIQRTGDMKLPSRQKIRELLAKAEKDSELISTYNSFAYSYSSLFSRTIDYYVGLLNFDYNIVPINAKWDEIKSSPKKMQEYKEDEERIIKAEMPNPKSVYYYSAITSKFVEAYCPDITGSIVYMGQCHGGHDYALATAFLEKGAVAVYGSSLQIQMHYGDMMQYRVTSLLGEINPNTKNYYTTGEALKKAQSEYGVDDSVLYEGGAMGARMILFGDPNFRLANK